MTSAGCYRGTSMRIMLGCFVRATWHWAPPTAHLELGWRTQARRRAEVGAGANGRPSREEILPPISF